MNKVTTYKMNIDGDGEVAAYARVSATNEPGVFQTNKAYYVGEWIGNQLRGRWLRWKKDGEKVKRTLKPRQGDLIQQTGRRQVNFWVDLDLAKLLPTAEARHKLINQLLRDHFKG